MKLATALMTTLVGGCLATTAAYAGDADGQTNWGGPLDGTALFQTVFGGSGLLNKWSSNETYGITQARVNLELSQNAMATATGITTGYKDSISQLVVPASALFGLADGRSFIAVSGSGLGERGHQDPTYGNVAIGSATIEYLHMPTDNFAWGIGASYEGVDTDLKANNATVNSYLGGLRADLLYKANDHFAVTSRVMALSGYANTMVPLGFIDLKNKQDFTRLYWQTDFVGTYSHKDFNFVGDGWLVHPTVTTVFQKTNRHDTVDNLGEAVDGDVINYAVAGASVRIEKPVFRPGAWSPQFEAGVEHEFENTYGSYTGEKNYLATKIGFGRHFGKSGYFNASYGREDGFTGTRRQQTLTLVYSLTF